MAVVTNYTSLPAPAAEQYGPRETWYWQIDDQGYVIRMALDVDGGVTVLPQVEGDDMDITLAPGPDGRPMMHRPDCPDVQVLREAGEPLMTLFDCEADPRDLDCPRHSCLEAER